MMDAAEAERGRPGVPRRAGRQAAGRGARGGRDDRRLFAAGVMMIKEASTAPTNRVCNEGMLFERPRVPFAVRDGDQKEGMAAFVEKRPAQFKHC